MNSTHLLCHLQIVEEQKPITLYVQGFLLLSQLQLKMQTLQTRIFFHPLTVSICFKWIILIGTSNMWWNSCDWWNKLLHRFITTWSWCMRESKFNDCSLLWGTEGIERWSLPQDCRDHWARRKMSTRWICGTTKRNYFCWKNKVWHCSFPVMSNTSICHIHHFRRVMKSKPSLLFHEAHISSFINFIP